LPQRVVQKMLEQDSFSRWLGITVDEIGPGRCVVSLTVRPEMLNGFGLCHGGITFSLADSALAFASNSHGRVAMSIEAGMAYPASVKVGDRISAVAAEESCTNRIGVYSVIVRLEGIAQVEVSSATPNDSAKPVGVFRGTVYRTDRELIAEE